MGAERKDREHKGQNGDERDDDSFHRPLPVAGILVGCFECSDPPAFESANDQNAQCDCDEQQYRPTVKHDSRQLPSMGISVNQVAPAWGHPAAEDAGGSARSPVAVAYQLR
jgi:hypothetical protein